MSASSLIPSRFHEKKKRKKRRPGGGGGGGRGRRPSVSRRGLSGGFDLGGRPFLLPPGVLADKRAVLVELGVLVAVVHQAVAAVRRFDLPAQRVLAALQRLLVVVAARQTRTI